MVQTVAFQLRGHGHLKWGISADHLGFMEPLQAAFVQCMLVQLVPGASAYDIIWSLVSWEQRPRVFSLVLLLSQLHVS